MSWYFRLKARRANLVALIETIDRLLETSPIHPTVEAIKEIQGTALNLSWDDPEESVGGYPLVAVYIAHIPLPALDHKTLRSIDSMYSEIVASRPGRVSVQVFKDAPGVFSWLPIFSSDKDITDRVWEVIEESLKLIWEGYE